MKKVSSIVVLICLFSWIVLTQGCKKATLPEVVTIEVSGIALNTATSGGEITSDGGDDILEKGVCWNTSGDPTIADSKTNDGTGAESFTSNLAGLQKGTVYYVCAYATNSVGTAYGEQFIFSTQIDDVDGNKYNTTLIGSQLWMAENIKATKYKDNTQIPNVTGNTAWTALTTHGYCWYNNDAAFHKPINGALYNFYAVSSGKLCPTGWHVPTDAEYNTMELSLGMTQADVDKTGWRGTDQGTKLKNSTGWSAGENGTNTTGFSALPGGYRYYTDGTFNGVNILGYWWTGTSQGTTLAWYRRLDGNNSGIYKANTSKTAGKSVRCIKD